MDKVQCQTLSSVELLEGNYETSMSGTNIDTLTDCHSIAGPFTCNGCGTTFDTSCGLHTHMTNQHSDGSYHYDHLIKTAFPKSASCCAGTQPSKMDKKYLRRYSDSRTEKPPKKVGNVTVKSEVRDKFICMNLPSDEPAPQTREEEYQDKITLAQSHSVSSVPYTFRTTCTTHHRRLSLQDCFVQLDCLEVSQFENDNDVKKKALNTKVSLCHTTMDNEKSLLSANDNIHVCPVSNAEKDKSRKTDIIGSSYTQSNESSPVATAEANIDIKTHIMKQEPLDYLSSTVKRKRGRPRKIKVSLSSSLCHTTMDNEKSLFSANDNIHVCPVSKDKGRKTDITKSNERSPVATAEVNIDMELLDEPDCEMVEDDHWDDIQSISEVDQKHTGPSSNTAEKRLSVTEADNEDTSKSALEFDNSGAATDGQQTVKRKRGRPVKCKRGRPMKIKEGLCDTTIDNEEKSLMSANANTCICPEANREKNKSREIDITASP